MHKDADDLLEICRNLRRWRHLSARPYEAPERGSSKAGDCPLRRRDQDLSRSILDCDPP
jgi:hypothetical protein